MIFLFLLLVVFSCFWIYKACNLFEKGANVISQNMAPGLKGATINAVGSSLPELIISFLFLFFLRTEGGFATSLATIVGSSIFNLLVIPGISLIVFFSFKKIKKIKIQKSIVRRDSFFFIFSLLILFLFLDGRNLNWKLGSILIFSYLLYTFCMILQQRKFSKLNLEKKIITRIEYLRNWGKISFSILQVTIACYILAESVIKISSLLNLNPYFVSMILSAVATSIPDLFLSIKDAKKGNIESSLSNAIGSNIFDICISLGFPIFVYTLIISPIEVGNNINFLELKGIIIMLIVSNIACFLLPKFFKPFSSIVLLGLYILFLIYCTLVYLF